jgi:hypothetical protein
MLRGFFVFKNGKIIFYWVIIPKSSIELPREGNKKLAIRQTIFN